MYQISDNVYSSSKTCLAHGDTVISYYRMKMTVQKINQDTGYIFILSVYCVFGWQPLTSVFMSSCTTWNDYRCNTKKVKHMWLHDAIVMVYFVYRHQETKTMTSFVFFFFQLSTLTTYDPSRFCVKSFSPAASTGHKHWLCQLCSSHLHNPLIYLSIYSFSLCCLPMPPLYLSITLLTFSLFALCNPL